MWQRKNKDDRKHDSESMFDRWLREKRLKKQLAKNDALFFGMYVMFALFAAQGMFTIQ